MRVSPGGTEQCGRATACLEFLPAKFCISVHVGFLFFYFLFWLLLFSVISTNLIFLGAMTSLIFENIHFLFVASEWK